jgi:vacuolar-type H+-ATPase subunit I/STV1
MPGDSNDRTEMELSRIRHAFWLAIIGLVLAAALAVFLVVKGEAQLKTSAEVVAIVGLFTSVTGTLVGAFFGLQVGAACAEHERSSRQKAEHLTRLALSHLGPDVAKEVLGNSERES